MARNNKNRNRNANNQRAKVNQSDSAVKARNKNDDIDQGLKSVDKLMEDEPEAGTFSSLRAKFSNAKKSNEVALSEQKQKIADNLEENISQLVGELKKLIKDTSEIEANWQRKHNTIEQLEREARDNKKEIDREMKSLEADKSASKDAQVRIADQQANIANRLRVVEEKELDAETGFSKINEKMLSTFQIDKEKELEIFQQRKESIQRDISELFEKKLTLQKEVNSQQDAAIERIREKELNLQQKEDGLVLKEENLKRSKLRLDRSERVVEETRSELKEEVRNEFVFELNKSKNANESLLSQIEKYQDSEVALKFKLDSYEQLQEVLNGEEPDVILKRIESLKLKNLELHKELDLKPSNELEEKYKKLKDKYQSLESVLARKEQELSQESKRESLLRISAVAQETLEQEKLTLTKANEVLKSRHKMLRHEVDEAMNDQESKSPFPTLLSMDSGNFKDKRGNVDHRRELPTETVPDLRSFASELRHRIAWDSQSKKELYYSESDIRIFVAGLAMSKLHILQGISGTGKTSLALAFARAVGGHCKTVAVQAGWRDKDDLVGHYNSFEKKFYERACLEGLYEAQTPLYRDRPYIILLDEMNLSRPEQYFSEFLSAMEQDIGKQFLELMTESIKGAPHCMKNGRSLEIPHNVWFVGTANHDETTFEFADKTYDRSHVMELPRHEESFEINRDIGKINFGFSSLEQAFTKAQHDYEDRVNSSLKTIYESDLVKHLREDLDVSWGNRFERQADRFVSTLIATGGKESEAFDHLLATKIFRNGKATGRYDTEKEDIETVKLCLETLWVDLGYNDSPEKSLKLLDKELRRKGA
jgi:hypothetical protein